MGLAREVLRGCHLGIDMLRIKAGGGARSVGLPHRGAARTLDKLHRAGRGVDACVLRGWGREGIFSVGLAEDRASAGGE